MTVEEISHFFIYIIIIIIIIFNEGAQVAAAVFSGTLHKQSKSAIDIGTPDCFLAVSLLRSRFLGLSPAVELFLKVVIFWHGFYLLVQVTSKKL